MCLSKLTDYIFNSIKSLLCGLREWICTNQNIVCIVCAENEGPNHSKQMHKLQYRALSLRQRQNRKNMKKGEVDCLKRLTYVQNAMVSIFSCMRGSRRGRGRGPDPPEKSQKYRVSLQYWSGSPEKSQSYQASIQCWAIICPPAKHH